MMALASVIALYGLSYVVLGERMYGTALGDSFRARPWGIYPHAFFGMIAIAIGPWQFRRSLVRNRRALHRRLGKAYVVCGLLTGVSGLYMAAYSFGGWVTHVGFGGMSLAILITTSVAFVRIRAGDIEGHRAWMVRSFAVLFSGVTLRLWLPVLVIAYDGAFTPAYMWVAYLSWIPNLLVVEWYLRMRHSRSDRDPRRGHLAGPSPAPA